MTDLNIDIQGNDGFSKPIYGILGEFTKDLTGQSPIRVPFFAGVASFEQLSNDICLVMDDPHYAEQNWRVGELFQRDIDEHRAYLIAKQYLAEQARGEAPFFNSITIALRSNGASHPLCGGRHSLGVATQYLYSKGVSVSATPSADPGNIACLSWHSDSVSAFAIDGQHRLSAIKSFCRENMGNPKRNYCSLVVLLLDKDLGFKAFEDGIGDSALQAMRKFFIDLNKRAKSVSTARQLLLDDFDLRSLCVRRLIGTALEIQTDPETSSLSLISGVRPGIDGDLVHRIPLSLVDWHSEDSAKVNSGPYVHSLLGLSWLVGKISKLRRFSYFDPPAFSIAEEEPYRPIRKALVNTPDPLKDRLLSRLNVLEELGAPFVLEEKEMEEITALFGRTWGRAITRLSLCAPGYRDVVRIRMEGKSISSTFANWFQADSAVGESGRIPTPPEVKASCERRRDLLVKELGANTIISYKKLCAEINELKNNKRNSENPLFLLVGQRAMFTAFFRICDSLPSPGEYWEGGMSSYLNPSDPYDGIGKAFVDCLDFWAKGERLNNPIWNVRATFKRVNQDGKFSTAFWNAALLKKEDDQTVDFSGKAAERGSRWFEFMFRWWVGIQHSSGTANSWFSAIQACVRNGAGFDLGNSRVEADLRASISRLYLGNRKKKYDAPCFFAAVPASEEFDQEEVVGHAAKFLLDRCEVFLRCGWPG